MSMAIYQAPVRQFFESLTPYSCVPNKRGGRGEANSWASCRISKNQIGGGGGILFSGGVGKMKKIIFLCKMRYKLFNVYYLQ